MTGKQWPGYPFRKPPVRNAFLRGDAPQRRFTPLVNLPFFEGGGVPTDYSSKGNVITANGSPAWIGSEEGPVMNFVAASNQFLSLGANSADTDSFVIGTRVRLRDPTGNCQLAQRGQDSFGNGWNVNLSNNGSGQIVLSVVNTTPAAQSFTNTTVLAAEQWYDIAACYARTTGTTGFDFAIAINGVVQGISTGGPVNTLRSSTKGWRIGIGNSNTSGLDGDMAYFFILTLPQGVDTLDLSSSYNFNDMLRQIHFRRYGVWTIPGYRDVGSTSFGITTRRTLFPTVGQRRQITLGD